MVKPGIIVNQYPDQSYKTIFNQITGFLVRFEDQSGSPEPFWCSYGPELMDISITNWCDRNCAFCYKRSHADGVSLSLENYEKIIKQAAQMKVLQVALGGGNPNQHPDFCEILRMTRMEYNIVPSYTTNGIGLSEEIIKASKKYCGAVAVSIYEPYEETFEALNYLFSFDIRTNIHFLLTDDSLSAAIKWLENPPTLFNNLNAIIFLNYKPVGRNPDQTRLAKNNSELIKFFELAGKHHPFKIGFDSCSISGIARFINVNPSFIERCEASRFSMYISEDMKMYPCSFMIDKTEGVPVTEDNIQSVWRSHPLFKSMRELLSQKRCHNCPVDAICSGGCPVYPEINICPEGSNE